MEKYVIKDNCGHPYVVQLQQDGKYSRDKEGYAKFSLEEVMERLYH